MKKPKSLNVWVEPGIARTLRVLGWGPMWTKKRRIHHVRATLTLTTPPRKKKK